MEFKCACEGVENKFLKLKLTLPLTLLLGGLWGLGGGSNGLSLLYAFFLAVMHLVDEFFHVLDALRLEQAGQSAGRLCALFDQGQDSFGVHLQFPRFDHRVVETEFLNEFALHRSMMIGQDHTVGGDIFSTGAL